VSITFDAAAQHERAFDLHGPANYRRKKTAGTPAVSSEAQNELDLLDRFKHLECGLVCADKKTLEVFTQTLALQCVATCALFFSSHGDLLNVNAILESAISESIEL
jgi:hypothetical protein